MKAPALVLVTLALTACGSSDADKEIDPAFQDEIDIYLSIAPDRGRWDQLKSVGYCEPHSGAGYSGGCKWHDRKFEDSYSRICINPKLRETPFTERSVLVHELAHCLHDIRHDESDPKGIMAFHTYVDEDYWAENLMPELRKLFQRDE